MGLHMRDPVRRELAKAFEHGQGGMARGRCRAIGKKQLQLRRKAHDGLTGFVVRDHHIVQFLIFDFLVHGFSFQLVTAAHLAASRSGSGAAVLPGSEKIQATSPTAIPTPAQQSPLSESRLPCRRSSVGLAVSMMSAPWQRGSCRRGNSWLLCGCSSCINLGKYRRHGPQEMHGPDR
jgi:hypothetical protein